jgi:outer membrane lipoprotein-sorting protein
MAPRHRGWIENVALASLAALLAAPVAAQTGLDVMKEQAKRSQTKSEEARVELTIIDPSGKEKKRELMTVAQRDEKGLARLMLKFLSPADIRNTGLLTWEQPGDQDDDQWLFLPATKRTQRIASSSKKKPFMGTDLAYEDLRAEDLAAHSYTLEGEEDLGGQKCWKISAVPATAKEKAESGYAKRTFWVRKDNYVTVQTEFYNESDKLVKRATFSDVANVSGDLWRPKTARYETLEGRKSTTVLTTTEYKANQPVDAVLLTEPGLMRPL